MAAIMAQPMVLDAPDLKPWLADRLRGTNWVAAGIAALLQLGFLAMLIYMGVVQTGEPKRDKPLVTILSSVEQAAPPPPPAAVQEQRQDKPVVQPKAEVIVPPAKVNLATSAPVAAAVQRAPGPPTPAPAAPCAPPAAPPPAASACIGPVTPNLHSNPLTAPSPDFPIRSRLKHESGVVILRVVVGEDGRVDEISVQRSSGFPALDEAALTAVRKWRWSPTIKDGRPTAITGTIGVNMVLRES